jgi:hypothetical protein
VTEVLALRLQAILHKLIDDGQTDFIQSRCIVDNFIYTLDLVQSCKQMKKEYHSPKTRFQEGF